MYNCMFNMYINIYYASTIIHISHTIPFYQTTGEARSGHTLHSSRSIDRKQCCCTCRQRTSTCECVCGNIQSEDVAGSWTKAKKKGETWRNRKSHYSLTPRLQWPWFKKTYQCQHDVMVLCHFETIRLLSQRQPSLTLMSSDSDEGAEIFERPLLES